MLSLSEERFAFVELVSRIRQDQFCFGASVFIKNNVDTFNAMGAKHLLFIGIDDDENIILVSLGKVLPPALVFDADVVVCYDFVECRCYVHKDRTGKYKSA